jgi:hypothetical protein
MFDPSDAVKAKGNGLDQILGNKNEKHSPEQELGV